MLEEEEEVYWTKADQSRQHCCLSILVILVGFHKYTIKSKSKYQLMVVEQACLDQREKSARAFAAAPRPGTVSPISGHAPSFPRGPPAFAAIFLEYFSRFSWLKYFFHLQQDWARGPMSYS